MAIETNNNLLKLNPTSGTSSAGSTQKPPYMSATDKALKSGASVFDVAKSQANKGTNSTKSTGDGKAQANSAVASANAATNKGEASTTTANASTAKSGQSTQDVKELSVASQAESKKAVAQIKGETPKIAALSEKSGTVGNEIQELEAQKEALNPFDGTGSGSNSAFSLNIASAPADSSNKGEENTASSGENTKNTENEQKLADINAQIEAKTGQKQGIDTKLTATTKKATNISNNAFKQLTLATTKFTTAQKVAQVAKTGADVVVVVGAATTATGIATSMVGNALASNPVSAPAAAAPITAGATGQETGATTTAAGTTAGTAAKAASDTALQSIGKNLQEFGKLSGAVAALKAATNKKTA
ncbi:MAG: hypothetical protein WCG95_01400 [bacterium]